MLSIPRLLFKLIFLCLFVCLNINEWLIIIIIIICIIYISSFTDSKNILLIVQENFTITRLMLI